MISFNKDNSNIVKGVAIIFMVAHHLFGCQPELWQQYHVVTAPFSVQSLYEVCIHAKICVSMFVFLTAFGITRQYNQKLESTGRKMLTKKELGAFALNRYIKLLFNFWFIYLLAVLTSFLRKGGFTGVYFVNGGKLSVVYIILDAFGVADYFGTPTLNETWWYMGLAAFLIFVIPILVICYKNYGILLVAVFSMISYIGLQDTGFTLYLFCVCMGVFCAEEQVLERLYQKKLFADKGLNTAVKCLLYLLLMGVLLYLRDITTYSYWLDAFFTIAVCGFSMELYEVWKHLGKVLCFLGEHSMNIFLVHTLIFEYYFTSFIYGFRYWILVILALLVISLLVSVFCEAVKKWIGYPAWTSRVVKAIDDKLLRLNE